MRTRVASWWVLPVALVDRPSVGAVSGALKLAEASLGVGGEGRLRRIFLKLAIHMIHDGLKEIVGTTVQLREPGLGDRQSKILGLPVGWPLRDEPG